MKKTIITTTIRSPSKATLEFCQKTVEDNWNFLIVGDKKTPHQKYIELESNYKNVEYLHPQKQSDLYSELSDLIGWNSIQRRNIGFVHAYKNMTEIFATVDDDNIPYANWGKDLFINKKIDVDLWSSPNGVFDPLSVTIRSDLWHRGYPLENLETKNNITYLGKHKRKVLIQSDLWDGDPDIDAICRLSKKPCVKYENHQPYGSNQISPFNSQNTFLSRKVMPYYAVLPCIGRMDDIWGSYIVQNKFPNCLIYNKPSVFQDRIEQDLILNLEKEIIGYKQTLDLLNNLNDWKQIVPENTKSFFNKYKEIMI